MKTKKLLECFVAGLVYSDFKVGKDKLKVGQKLTLLHEHDNEYDDQAIMVKAGKLKIGYIPKDQTYLIHGSDSPVRCVVKQFAPTNATHRMILLNILVSSLANKKSKTRVFPSF